MTTFHPGTDDPRVVNAYTDRARALGKVRKRQEQLRRAEIELAEANQVYNAAIKPVPPAEPGSIGAPRHIENYSSMGTAVITFTKTFNGAGTYHYAAIRPAGKPNWVITTASSTGTHGKYYSWAALMLFIAEKEPDQGRAALASIQEWIRK